MRTTSFITHYLPGIKFALPVIPELIPYMSVDIAITEPE